MKVYYWSPFISKVATVSSVLRSSESLIKYSKQNISVSLVDAIGEWDQYRHKINSKIQIIRLIIFLSKQFILENFSFKTFFN